MFYEVVRSLCAREGISITRLAEELKISRSNVTNWKNGSIPKMDKVGQIASYFGVSTDYLLGNEQKNKPVTENDRLDPLDRRIMELLGELNPENKKIALAQLDAMLKIQEKK